MEAKWEMVCKTEGEEQTRRLKVDGGWLYLHEHMSRLDSPESMVFVPEKKTEEDSE